MAKNDAYWDKDAVKFKTSNLLTGMGKTKMLLPKDSQKDNTVKLVFILLAQHTKNMRLSSKTTSTLANQDQLSLLSV